ncbi:MAG TPA: alpha/beta hydrolase [Acidimicrobiia bacterium]|jgi:acetyl esterase|nr:alpha/beta hydrolase [Acidimicrobiia bacterium]
MTVTGDEGVLDPWVKDFFEANPERNTVLDTLDPEILALARGDFSLPSDVEIASIEDSEVEGIPVRIYRDEEPPTGLVVYFHGGGFVLGSIGIMDNVARELCHRSGAVVVSVGYRLAPEDPYPAGLDDCETVTRWTVANASTFGVPASRVAIAGESAGGNLSAALALRFRDAGDVGLAGQVLIYPGTSGTQRFPSREQFDGLVINEKAATMYWDAYSSGRDLDDDPYAAPLHAEHLRNLPPALVILGGCDMLRDEGRAYAARLREDDVDVEEVCYAGQPHGFVNFDFPAAALAHDVIGGWLRARFAEVGE